MHEQGSSQRSVQQHYQRARTTRPVRRCATCDGLIRPKARVANTAQMDANLVPKPRRSVQKMGSEGRSPRSDNISAGEGSHQRPEPLVFACGNPVPVTGQGKCGTTVTRGERHRGWLGSDVEEDTCTRWGARTVPKLTPVRSLQDFGGEMRPADGGQVGRCARMVRHHHDCPRGGARPRRCVPWTGASGGKPLNHC